MKKIFITIIAILLPLLASATYIKGINYNLNSSSKTASVVQGSSIGSYSGNVIIPSQVTYNGYTYIVTSIGEKAFSLCYDLTSVTIPNSVTNIENYAFLLCSGLTSIIIPNSVTSIGSCAFDRCSSLTSVTIPNSVTSIDSEAFCECENLTSVHISDVKGWCKINFSGKYSNPLYYAHHLFLNEVEIKDLHIPNGITYINKDSFLGCSGLTSITIPNSVTSIGSSAFGGCSGLTSIKSEIEKPFDIDNSVISGIPACTKLIVPKGTKTKYMASEGWKNITSICEIIEGDVNLDDKVNMADVDALVDYIIGKTPESFNKNMADVNRDGKVNVADVTVQIALVNQNTNQGDLTFTVNGVSFKMIRVDGGTFSYGSDPVTLSTYYIGETEVTEELWEAVMGEKPFNSTGAQMPVAGYTRNSCLRFIKKLNELTGMNFRLPKMVEWGVAACGGNKSHGYKYAGSNTIGGVAWYAKNSNNKKHNVKQKSPNELGLYDMSGNVYEWCIDMEYNGEYYYSESEPFWEDANYYFRGGSYNSTTTDCRITSSEVTLYGFEWDQLGFRLAL